MKSRPWNSLDKQTEITVPVQFSHNIQQQTKSHYRLKASVLVNQSTKANIYCKPANTITFAHAFAHILKQAPRK